MPRDSKASAAFAAEMAQRRAEMRAAWDTGRLERVRRICMAYPYVTEVEQAGEPCWRAGKKAFAAYGAQDPDGTPRDGMSFNVSAAQQAELVADGRFVATPRTGPQGWTTLRFGSTVDWAEVEELVDLAYRKVALRHMLQKLDHAADEAALALAAVRDL